MALQSSGAIKISEIKAELDSSSNSLRALSDAAGFSTPDAMSEFYGFSAGPPPAIELSYLRLKIDPLSSNQLKFTLDNFDPYWPDSPNNIVYFDITLRVHQFSFGRLYKYQQNHIFELPLVRNSSYSVPREPLGWGASYRDTFDLDAFNLDFVYPVNAIYVINKTNQNVPLP
jgi:hypothetical protein